MAPPPNQKCKTKSFVWQYFTKETDTIAKCKLCGKRVKSCGNTTNASLHINRIHKNHISETIENIEIENTTSTLKMAEATQINIDKDERYIPKSSTSTITSAFKTMNSFLEGGSKHSEISDAVLFMICKDNLPLSTVENIGFRKLLNTVAPLYKLPSRKYFTSLLERRYEVCKTQYKDKIIKAECVSLTTDIWTDSQMRSFLGLTVHFLDGVSLQSGTFGVYLMDERHTAEYIVHKMQEACCEWGLSEENIVGIVSDNAGNMVKACETMLGKNKHIHCCAHTLNLVPEKILKTTEISDLLEKVRKIVKWFKTSVVGSDQLRKIQKERGIPENKILKVIHDVPTRWNSTYHMLERFVDLSSEINEILLKSVTAPTMLTAVDLTTIKEMKDLLKPLELVTKELSAEKYVTISKIIPIIHCMEKQVDNYEPASDLMKNLKSHLKTEIEKRFGQMEYTHHLAISTVLDPRFKKIHFIDFLAAARAVQNIKTIGLSNNSNTNQNDGLASRLPVVSTTDAENTTTGIWSYHNSLVQECNLINNDEFDSILAAEITQYLNGPLAKLSENPIEKWETMKFTFPNLYTIARKYLQVPGTSVPCERLFSKSGQILNDLRSRLNAQRVNKLIFLNSLDEW